MSSVNHVHNSVLSELRQSFIDCKTELLKYKDLFRQECKLTSYLKSQIGELKVINDKLEQCLKN